MTQATYSQARRASLEIGEKLSETFGAAAGGPVNGYGVQADARRGYYVAIYMERAATKEEEKQLPHTHKGVAVRYEVIGQIRPQ